MLIRVIGQAGCGKTRRIEDMITQELKKSNPILYLVPEQHTVCAERSLLSRTNEPTRRLEITNFSRLPNIVFRSEGGVVSQNIDKAGKRLLLASVLNTSSDSLSFYRQISARSDFIEILQSLSDELLEKNISPKTLLSLSEQTASNILCGKLKDLSLILAAYIARLNTIGCDSTEEMFRLASLLETNTFFSGYTVFLDGFYSYTAPEYALLRQLIRQCENIVITFEMPSNVDPSSPGAFQSVVSAMERISAMAKEENIGISDIFPDYILPVSDGLRFLCDHLANGRVEVYHKKTDDIAVFSTNDRYTEVTEVARRIRKLIQKGARYRDIRVFARNPENYRGIIEPLFSYYGIPCSLQQHRSPLTHPLSDFLFASLEMIFHTPTLYSFQNLIKSGYTGIDAEDSFEIESYCQMWNISGNTYFAPFVMHPRGYLDHFDPEDEQTLFAINICRARLMDPIHTCKNAVKGKSVRETAAAFWQYIEETGIFDRLSREADLLKEKGDFSAAGELLTLWNAWISALDQLVLVMGDEKVNDGFTDYLRVALSALEFGTLPASLDEVEFGEIGFIRSEHPAHLFLLGVNEGTFPAQPMQSGIFTHRERMILTSSGLDMDRDEFRSEDEHFKFYCAASAPTQTLTLSYVTAADSTASVDSGSASPSIFIDQLTAMFPEILISASPLSEEPLIPAEVVSLALRENGGKVRAMILDYLDKNPNTPTAPMIAEALLASKNVSSGASSIRPGDTQTLALTQARYDAYTKCPYSYYAKYLLSAKEERSGTFSFADVGNYLHRILEVFMSSLSASEKPFKEWSDSEIKNEIHTYVEEYLTSLHIGEKRSARFDYLLTRLEKSLFRLLISLRDEFSEGQFVPVGFEFAIGDKQPPYTVTLKDGTEARFYGIIDRIDIYTDETGESFIRIADYKSSVKKLSMQDIYNGFNIQLLVYLFAVWKDGLHLNGKTTEVSPAGVMYIPTVREAVSTEIPLSPDQELMESNKSVKRDGLFLDSENILRAMEPNLEGKFIPVTVKKNNKLDPKKLISAAFFGKLKKHIEKLIASVAEEIKKGNIAANPNLSAGACDYCPYLPMCKNTEKKGRKYHSLGSDEEIRQKLEEANG